MARTFGARDAPIFGLHAVAQGLVRNGGRWPADLPEWERLIEKPLRDLTRGDLRTGVLARKYLLPWRFLDKDYAVEAFAARLEERLTPLRLCELPERPVFALCATDLSFGAAFIFSRERMGIASLNADGLARSQ